MKPVFVAIIFLFEGEPTLLEGFMPRQQSDMKVCENRLARFDNYVKVLEQDLPEDIQVLTTLCGTEEKILHIVETGKVSE